VGAPFFNKVTIPVALLLLFLTGVGAAAGVAEDLDGKLKRNFGWPMAMDLSRA